MSASPDEHAGTGASAAAPDAAPAAAAPEGAGSSEVGSAELDQAISRVEHELGRLFARIRVSWREAATTVHPDLQPLGYQVLTSIATGKATSAGAIIERLQTDKSAVSRQVRQLEELGLVESVRDPDDRRARVLVATDLAQERVALARSRYEERLGERLRRWSAEDLDHFTELLAAFGD
ncbi:MarR family transcriptional regulator [Microbacterium sp. TPD7012]|uniref:MarR family winged helix-turn-helix transcriptional regulator n=1 Tax=Microbacterium sp. TPD7012 TaxID=2171975 RepID=UPI000D50E105|nr:MarR family transcriptional regulator [Microbacterium sp. TPD7012]PVE94634.1 MarR family transcriptional regulator [Microbacterium sp. TPD7012]